MADRRDKLIAAAHRRLERLKVTECFDPRDLNSRPTDSQGEVLDDLGSVQYRYVLGGNQSGKTQLGAREVSWVFQESHPRWERPAEWADEPLLILVMGRTSTQLTETIWKKLERFLEAGTYNVVLRNGAIQKVVHKENGNTIIFLSHHAENEAREKAQAFVAHYVWLDEMPGSYELIEELHRRIQARRGHFLATFTPKVVNAKIQKLVDASDGSRARKYKLRMFDNPTYTEEDKENILSTLVAASETYKKTVLEGDWAVGEEQVYFFDYDTMVEMPEGYNPVTWRHVESVDPALKSKFGFTIWAEDPRTGIWYCVVAEYITGIFDPVAIYREVAHRTSRFNIVRRVCDPHEAWYLGTASAQRAKPAYVTPYSKNNRKGELIKQLQHKLGSKLRIAPHCESLINEFTDCRWSDRAENKIVNSSSYHLLDTAQYFADLIPDDAGREEPYTSWDDFVYRDNEKRKEKEAAAAKKKQTNGGRVVRAKRKKWRVKSTWN